MIRRVVWFAVGAGVGVYALVRVRRYLAQATPEAIGQRVADRANGITGSVQEFGSRVRAAMAEREAELRTELGLSE
ncbi:hypothetical protein FHX74_002736 [Friedmanniella endophytica]|uniref:Secreted protein n=1 Tax=Microlunatus kandeliicorticis TaxID=1759536 RepID=A0A7W3ITV7_9ACTN|nr:DUF6167 family protein [Microlunatus kandeliicorticis]MBA8795108.1 hypothetical protein [Microlunatus kandeliicorticis]